MGGGGGGPFVGRSPDELRDLVRTRTRPRSRPSRPSSPVHLEAFWERTTRVTWRPPAKGSMG